MRCAIKEWSLYILLMFLFATPKAEPKFWVSGYYPAWAQDILPPVNIEFGALTHLIHFSFLPNEDGTLQDNFGMSASHCDETVAAAHSASKKVILCIGSVNTATAFRGATLDGVRATFISNIVNKLTTHGYDGIDIDWEHLSSSDSTQFKVFIRELRTALDNISPSLLLTAAASEDYWDPDIRYMYNSIKDEFDQINLMTYCMSGPWEGWLTWHGSALFSGTHGFPDDPSRLLPSAQHYIDLWNEAGIPKSKLGIGIGFHGDVWTGETSDLYQMWSSAPLLRNDIPYKTIMLSYYDAGHYRYDSMAEASYLSIVNTGTGKDQFVSYTDERAVAARMSYLDTSGVGGAIIWEISQDYRAPGNHPLMTAVKNGLTKSQGTIAPVRKKVSPTLHVIPNKLRSTLTVSLPGKKLTNGRLTVFDCQGRTIYRSAFSGQKCEIGGSSRIMPNGIYITRADGKGLTLNKNTLMVR